MNDKKPGILKGAAWIGSSRLLIRFLGLCSTIVLARLLTPEDFGLVAIATGLIGLLETFSEFGFNHALIRFQDADENDYSTAWTLNVCRGLIICVIISILAYPLSVSFNDRRLASIFWILSVLPLIRGLENPRLIIFEKQMKFDVLFRVMVITKLLGVITTIILAFLWRSYWVLIFGMLVTNITRTILSYYYAPGKVSFTAKRWRKLFGFSGWILSTQILKGLGQRLDPIILAAFSTTHVVGILHIARELSNMTFIEVAAPVRRVLFPALSRLSSESPEFIKTYKESVRGLFFVLAPICIGFILTVPDIVPLVLGRQWMEAVRPIQWILSFLTISILGQMAHSAIMAKGESRPLFIQSLIVVPIKVLVFSISVYWFELKGAVFGICIGLCIETITNMCIAIRATKLGFIKHFSLANRTLLPLFLMFLVVFSISGCFLSDRGNAYEHLLRLFIMVAGGVFVYSFSSYWTWHISGRPRGPEAVIIEGFSSILHRLKTSTR